MKVLKRTQVKNLTKKCQTNYGWRNKKFKEKNFRKNIKNSVRFRGEQKHSPIITFRGMSYGLDSPVVWIKNIENSSNHTDYNGEKEEEKIVNNLQQRRESVPNDATKLNTIKENSSAISTAFALPTSTPTPTPTLTLGAPSAASSTTFTSSSQLLTSSLCLKTQRSCDLQRSSGDYTSTSTPTPIAAAAAEIATVITTQNNTINTSAETPNTAHLIAEIKTITSTISTAITETITTTTTTAETTPSLTTTTATATLADPLGVNDSYQQQTTIIPNNKNFSSEALLNIPSITDNTTITTSSSPTSGNSEIDTASGIATKELKTSNSPHSSPNQRKTSSSSTSTGSFSKGFKLTKTPSLTKIASNNSGSASGGSSAGCKNDEDTLSKSSDNFGGELIRGTFLTTQQQQQQQEQTTLQSISPSDKVGAAEKAKYSTRLSERAKKKSWYNVIYPNYKSRAEDFKKLFKEVPNEERLIVDYSCALQREILLQGRLYVSQNYVCFHANIFSWETYLSIKWKDVTSITKEKTALVIPNAISICTAKEKFFFATFTSRDKAFLMLFRVWQNTLMNKPMLSQEIWQWVHNCYGDELGLTTDDEDYIDPTGLPSLSAIDNNDSCCSVSGIGGDLESGDTDFASALDTDTQSIHCTGSENNSSAQSQSQSNNRNQKNTASGHSSTSSGGSGKVKTKRSYFFSSNKSNSNTASASGSDNKASDNNSSVELVAKSGGCKGNNPTLVGDKTKITNKMKANAKELVLTSAKMDDGSGSGSGGGGSGGGVGSGAGSGGEHNTNTITTKEVKQDLKSSASVYESKRKSAKNSRQRDDSCSKKSEQLPTDMSNSSDSDENKIPFVVTAECNSTHEGRQIVHTILPINIDTLFNLLFSKSKFLLDFHAMRKTADLNFGEWVQNNDGQQMRTVNLTVQLAASVGPKTSKVTEYQVMRDCSKPGELYSIDVTSVNAGIPYADSFSVLMHFCLVRNVDDHTMLSLHAQIKYKKSIWGVVKGLIEKNTWVGLEDFYTALLQTLQNETCIPPAKGKGRRPRRGTTTQIRPIEEAPTAQMKPEPTENSLTPHIMQPHIPIMNNLLPIEKKSNYKWLSLFVIGLLTFLIILNVILLLKLWNLEERIDDDLNNRARLPNLAALKQLPSSHEEWLDLLRQQEILHETELKKWHTVLQTAIELLKKTEKTLAGLMFR